MTDKEFITQACAELEIKIHFLKKENRKMDVELKKLRKEIALQKKNGGFICSTDLNNNRNIQIHFNS